MKIEFVLTPQIMQLGAAIAYKQIVLKKTLILYAILYLLFNFWILAGAGIASRIILFFFFSVLVFVNRHLYIRRASRALFKGRGNELTHTIETHEDKLTSVTTTTNSSINWEHFVDLKIHKNGILLYPQKNIFFFIPSSVAISEGSWEELSQLLKSKIQKKI